MLLTQQLQALLKVSQSLPYLLWNQFYRRFCSCTDIADPQTMSTWHFYTSFLIKQRWIKGVQGVHTATPQDEAFFFIFAIKICLLRQSVMPFLSVAPPPKDWGICILILCLYSAWLHCEITSLSLIVLKALIIWRVVIEDSNWQLLQLSTVDFHPKRIKYA